MSGITKKQFKHDFLRGLGSALLELKTCSNPQKYYGIVHYGCLHNTTYDMQCEGNRGWYLHQAALYVGATSIENAVIERYSHSFTDDWLFEQLTSILYHFAADGSKASSAALYDKYNILLNKLSRIHVKSQNHLCPNRDMFDWLCVWLTSLNGWSAFKKIVNEVGEKLIPKDADFFFSDWFYDNSKNKFGKERVELYLAKQSYKSKSAKNYWIKAQEWNNHQFEKHSVPTLEEVIKGARDESLRGRGLSILLARNANPNELDKLLQTAMEEQDLHIRAELLWGFRGVKFPIPQDCIAELLQSDNEDIRDTAFCIMENNPSPETREYALSLLEKGEDVSNAISLLSRNLIKNDEQMFCDLVKSIPVEFDEGDWHGVFMSAEMEMKCLRGKPNTDLLQYIYRQTYCSCCRELIVRLMLKKGVLSKSLLKECLYDSHSEIRRFAKTIKKRQYKA